jgi:hypothetical protein
VSDLGKKKVENCTENTFSFCDDKKESHNKDIMDITDHSHDGHNGHHRKHGHHDITDITGWKAILDVAVGIPS